MKAAHYRNWIASGGAPADFVAAWPEMRREVLKRRTLETEEQARVENRHRTLRTF